MEDIRPLTGMDIDTLYTAWDEGFKGYASSWNQTELQRMLHRRGYVPHLSFGAFENNRLVSFTLNGIGMFKGTLTAYDTGTATIEAFRGKGLASRIFTASLPYLKEAGCEQYLLEVLQDNTGAISVYRNMGFTISRGFHYFSQDLETIQLNGKQLPASYQLRPIDLHQKDAMTALGDHIPSWQNSFEAISRKPDDFIITGVFNNNTLAGYGIIEPAGGDITQLAVHKHYRRQGIASAILKDLLQHNRHSRIKVINTAATDEAITSFLQNNGIPKRGAQYEMIRVLN